MRLNNNKKIISTDDVFSTNNSNIGNDLSLILLKHNEDISDLKSNVKWLYKYGGVGGSGSGSGVNKTKAKFTIDYTNTAGIEILGQDLSNNDVVNIKKGTTFKITATIVSILSLPQYAFSVGDSLIMIPSTSPNGSILIYPSNNASYLITLRGETTITLNVTVNTDLYRITNNLYYVNTILGNLSSVYQSILPNSTYKVIFTNYLPEEFEGNIDRLLVNGLNFDITNYKTDNLIEEAGSQPRREIALNIPASLIFVNNNYGIYTVLLVINYNGVELTLENQYIYLSDDIYVYAYSNGRYSIYEDIESKPNPVNSRLVSLYFKVYGRQSSTPIDTYDIEISVNGLSVNRICLNRVELLYVIKNTSEASLENPDLIEIIFRSGQYSKTYYIYLYKATPLTYFFKNDNGNFYHAVEYNTSYKNDDPIILFPEFNNDKGYYEVTRDLTSRLTEISKYSGSIPSSGVYNLVDYISGTPQQSELAQPDMLLSFGLKYGGTNYKNPIISLYNGVSGSPLTITLNRLSLVFSGGTSNEDILIPDDGEYHLILLYLKSCYSSVVDDTITSDTGRQYILLFIDGILEMAPLQVSRFYASTNLQVTFHAGPWTYNHFGIATFNNLWTNWGDTVSLNFNDCRQVFKYLCDFDPFIVSNYYNTWKSEIFNAEPSQLSSDIYETFGLNWINLFTPESQNGEGSDTFETLLKFIKINPGTISHFIPNEMDMFCISPTSVEGVNGFNPFLRDTLESYGETALLATTRCSLNKWDGAGFKPVLSNPQDPGGELILFYVTYQGSSTLLYSVKNFEIGTVDTYDPVNDKNLSNYFTLDSELFPYLETSFNLKADIVDSSSANNITTGAFVNDYMGDSPFNYRDRKYKHCLVGKPVILYMQNNIDGGSNEYIFLGIYTLTLNRSSVHNLGYARLTDNNGNDITEYRTGVTENIKYYILGPTDKDTLDKNFIVAEIQGNSKLYDFSLYDHTLMQEMFGDYFWKSGESIENTYNTELFKPLRQLSSYVYKKIINNELTQQIRFKTVDDIEYVDAPQGDFYYRGERYENLISISTLTNPKFFVAVDGLKQYNEYEQVGEKYVSKVTNPLYQFHVVVDRNGVPQKNLNNATYYVVEELNVPYNYENSSSLNEFDLNFSVKYFIVSMVCAMVDSILKNLTVKCADYLPNSKSIWFPAFYDMDTGFRKNNSGGRVSFQAFSDYVGSSDPIKNQIISDYAPSSASGDWYDIPSTYLFMFAKYAGILDANYLIGVEDDKTKWICPYNYWVLLRNRGGLLETAQKFCDSYVHPIFKQIDPIVWNLNYMYKYFSQSKVELGNLDTEVSKFSGTELHQRVEWLDKRIKFLDAMFGINVNRNIGLGSETIAPNPSYQPSNPDVTIMLSMFPSYAKECIGPILAHVEGDPKTPIVLKLSDGDLRLMIIDDTGNGSIEGNVLSNTNVGFYGTKNILKLNEFSLFMTSRSNDNTIENNRITEVTLNIAQDLNEKRPLIFDLNTIQSVETIDIVGIGVKKKVSGITVKSGGSTTYSLERVKISNVNGPITIGNGANSFTINRLELDNVTSSLFLILGCTINEIIINSNCLINSYNILQTTILSDLTITDSSCVNLLLLSVLMNNKNVNINNLKLRSLTILSGKFNNINIVNCSSLETLEIGRLNNNVKCNNLYLNPQSFSNTNNIITEATLYLESNSNNYIGLRMSNFSQLAKITVNSNNPIIPLNYAFNMDKNLQHVVGNFILDILNLKGIFGSCLRLNKSWILDLTIQDLNNIKVCDVTDLFLVHNTLYNELTDIIEDDIDDLKPYIDFDFVIDFFNKLIESNYKISNITLTFYGQKGIEISPLTIFGGNLTTINTFEEALNSVLNNLCVTKYAFAETGMCFLTKNMTNKFNSIYNAFSGTYESFCFIETEALHKFVHIYGNTSIEDINRYPTMVFFDINDGSFNIKYDSEVSDIVSFDNLIIQTLSGVLPCATTISVSLMSGEFSFDFSGGFPSTLETVSIMYSHSQAGSNYKNLEQLSLNVPSGKKIQLKSCFLNTTTSNPYQGDNRELYCNLYNLLFNDNNLLRVEIDLSDNRMYFYNRFKKLLTELEFNYILQYYIDNKLQINGLFSYCTVLSNNSQLLRYKLSSFSSLTRTFNNFHLMRETDSGYREVYLNLDSIGKKQIINDDETTRYIDSNTLKSLYYTFSNCCFESLPNTLGYNGSIESMEYCFENCKYYNTHIGTPLQQPKSNNLTEDIISYYNYTEDGTDEQFLIIPNGFFDCAASGVSLTGCFSSSEDNLLSLTGCFGDTYNWTSSGLFRPSNTDNVFLNCRVFYTISRPANNNNGTCYIFPRWFTNIPGYYKMMNVKIPFALSQYNCFIFEESLANITSYGRLPDIATSKTNDSHWIIVLGQSNENGFISGPIYLHSDSILSKFARGKLYKEIIPPKLSVLLSPGTGVIDDINNVNINYNKPVIYNVTYLAPMGLFGNLNIENLIFCHSRTTGLRLDNQELILGFTV